MEDRIWMDAPWPALRVRQAQGRAWAEPNQAARAAPFMVALAPQVLADLAQASLAPDAPAVCQVRAGAFEVRCVHVRLEDGALLWMQSVAGDAAALDVELASAQLAQVRHEAEVLKRGLLMAQAAVWRIDLTTQRIHFDVLGFEAANFHFDASGMELDALRQSIHPDDLALVTQAAADAMASERVVDVEARYLDARGLWRTLLTRRVAERDAQGRAVALAGVSLDVSRQRAEHERAEVLAQRTRLVAEVMGVGFFSRDAASDLAHWDDQMYRIHRRDPALGPLGREAWIEQCVHEQDRAWLRARVREADARWEPLVSFTFRATDAVDAVGADGVASPRWIQLWVRRVQREGRRMTYGMHLDVTDRQRAEQLVKQERRRAQIAVSAAGVGVWERDVKGVMVYWNEAMYRMRGLAPDDPRTPEEIMAQFTHPRDRARLQALYREHVASDEPYRYELRVRVADGSWRWLVTHGQALRDENGALLGVAGVNLDVTERKNAELLRLQAQRQEQASQDKLAFMARMSHELRTPMNAVLGFARLMGGDAADPVSSGQRERLAHIDDAGQRLLALIDDMLETSQAPAVPARDLPTGSGEAGSVEPGRAHGLHVLCVEDNPVNLQLVRELLRMRPSVRLTTAEDGRSGIALALAEPPDLLLLDLQLPDINGTLVMQKLRAEPAMAACRFVALSADAMPQQVQAGLAAGFDDYWTKPIQFDRFLAGIDNLLAARDATPGQ